MALTDFLTAWVVSVWWAYHVLFILPLSKFRLSVMFYCHLEQMCIETLLLTVFVFVLQGRVLCVIVLPVLELALVDHVGQELIKIGLPLPLECGD